MITINIIYTVITTTRVLTTATGLTLAQKIITGVFTDMNPKNIIIINESTVWHSSELQVDHYLLDDINAVV